MSETSFSLVEIIRQVSKRIKFILLFTLICTVAGIIFALIAPKQYTSKASVIVRSPLVIDRNQLFRQAEYQNKPFFAGEDDIDHLLTISKSDTLMAYLVSKYDLIKHYKVNTYEEAITEARDNFKLTRNDTKNLELYFTDKDPNLAAALNRSTLEEMGRAFSNSFIETNKDIIKSLQHRIKTVDDTLAQIDAAIKSMRAEYGIYNKLLPSRTEQAITGTDAAGVSPFVAEGLEKIQETIVLKDKFTQDRARYFSLINEFSAGLQNDAVNMLYTVQPPTTPSGHSSPILILIAGVCAIGGFFFASLLVVTSAFYRSIIS